MNANKGILAPLFVALTLVTYRGVRSGSNANNPVSHLPLPNQLVGAVAVFGALSLFSGRAEKPATVAAWGLDVAILLNLWNPAKTPATQPKTGTTKTAQGTTSAAKN